MFKISQAALKATATVLLVAVSLSGHTARGNGSTVIALPDLNNDGVADYFMRMPVWSTHTEVVGQFRVFSGADNSLLKAFTSLQVDDGFGVSTSSAGDLDGDGVDDLIIGAPYATSDGVMCGKVYLISGANGAILDILQTPPMSYGGSTVAGLRDIDGDGIREVAYSLRQPSGPTEDTGYVLVYSPGTGNTLLALQGPVGDTSFGYAIAFLGDTNGDGSPEIAVSAPAATTQTPNALGCVYIFECLNADGSVRAAQTVSDARVVLENATLPYAVFGGSMYLGPDLNNNGARELVVGTTIFAAPAVLAVIQAYDMVSGAVVKTLTLDSQKLRSDINGDLVVDNRDVAEALARMNAPADPLDPKSGDIDGDGLVGAGDVVSVIDNIDQNLVTPGTFSNGQNSEVTELVTTLLFFRPEPCSGVGTGPGGAFGGIVFPIEGPNAPGDIPDQPIVPEDPACCIWRHMMLRFGPDIAGERPAGCDDGNGGGGPPGGRPRPGDPGGPDDPDGGSNPPECDNMVITGPTFVELNRTVIFTVNGAPSGLLLWDVSPWPTGPLFPMSTPGMPTYSVKGREAGSGSVVARVYRNGNVVCGDYVSLLVIDCSSMLIEGPQTLTLGSQAKYTLRDAGSGITAQWIAAGVTVVSQTDTTVTVRATEGGPALLQARAMFEGQLLQCTETVDISVDCATTIGGPQTVNPGQIVQYNASMPAGFSADWSVSGPASIIDFTDTTVMVRANGCGPITVRLNLDADEGPDPGCTVQLSVVSESAETPLQTSGPTNPVILLNSDGIGSLVLNASGGDGEYEWDVLRQPVDAAVYQVQNGGRRLAVAIHDPVTLTITVRSGVCDIQSRTWTYYATRGDLRGDSNSDGVINDSDEESEDEAPGVLVFKHIESSEMDLVPVQVRTDLNAAAEIPWSLVYPSARMAVYLDEDGTAALESEAIYTSQIPPVVYVKGIEASPAAGDVVMQLRFGATPANTVAADAILLSICEIVVHDARYFGASASGPGDIQFTIDDLNAPLPREIEVGGAITDGASLCVVRVEPDITGATGLRLGIRKPGPNPTDDPRAVGALFPTPAIVPQAPTLLPISDLDGSSLSNEALIPDGVAFFVPPEAYMDPSWLPSGAPSLNPLEECEISIEVELGGRAIGARPFLLRRPPIVVVHGLQGSATGYWGSDAYSESLGRPVPTRLYFVDYEPTNTGGYSENYHHVPLMIRQAIEEYRTGNDNGHHASRSLNNVRYAATRVDAVGHSMGGQIIRTYVSMYNGRTPRTTGIVGTNATGVWSDINVVRLGQWGNLNYLRPDNYMAGDIRRFVAIGSPFKGSPIANVANNYVAPSSFNRSTIHFAAYKLAVTTQRTLPESWMRQYPASDPRILVNNAALTAVNDLRKGSRMQELLELPGSYPQGRSRVAWYPLVGIATESAGVAPVQAVLWELLFELTWFRGKRILTLDDSLSELSPANSDLIVGQWSQRNAIDEHHLPNSGFPYFPNHAHTFHNLLSPLGITAQAMSIEMSVVGDPPAPSIADLFSAQRSPLLMGDLEGTRP